jgi:hypothetical protein
VLSTSTTSSLVDACWPLIAVRRLGDAANVTGITHELRIANPAAQTRMVSGRQCHPLTQEFETDSVAGLRGLELACCKQESDPLHVLGGDARFNASHAAWLARSKALRDSASAVPNVAQDSLPACFSF